MAFEVENLEATLADLRARGVTFERFDMSGFDVRGDTIAAPDNYPSKGTGEFGTFFYDSEGNLIGIAQPVRDASSKALLRFRASSRSEIRSRRTNAAIGTQSTVWPRAVA
jgi:hypothetical protein